jgi:pyruvate/2-oxoglutarate dehydrogenase complex dihydrolipoamide dehydrogenase (E3) component
MWIYSNEIHHNGQLGVGGGGNDVLVKVIADRISGRLLGAQMAGTEGVAKRIDIFATALQARMTVEQLAQLDLSCAPPSRPPGIRS